MEFRRFWTTRGAASIRSATIFFAALLALFALICGTSRDALASAGCNAVNTGGVTTAASAGVTLQARVNPLGRIPPACLGCHPASRHADVDKAAILMPDRVDPGTELGN